MREGTKKLFPTDYDHFKKDMMEAADSGDLPVILRMNEISDYTLNDFQDLFSDFCLETDLEMTGFLSLGENSDKLRMTLVVKQPEQKPQRILQ
jgi:hypothetical protein